MAAQCFNCGKGVMYGHSVSHAKNRTRKIFKPNLHQARVMIGGLNKKVKLCTKCQRQLKLKASSQNLMPEDIQPQPITLI